MFIKTGTKHASKSGIELAIFKAFREFLLVVRFIRLRLAVLLVDGFLLGHSTIYGAYKQAHNKEKENKGFTVGLESRKINEQR